MILRNATIKYKGYDPSTLSHSSNKRVCCSCDQCGKVRWIKFVAYSDLCKLCTNHNRSGSNHPFYGKHHSDETCNKMSKSHIGIIKSKKIKENMSKSKMGHLVSDKTKKKISEGNKIKYNNNPELWIHVHQQTNQDIVKHHYIYDHNDLSKYTTLMTRSKHTKLHWDFRKSNIIIPHINIKEKL